VKLFSFVALAMTADLVSFALIVPLVGIGAESNGLLARGYLEFGILGVALFKVAATGLILALVLRARRNRLAAAALGTAIGLVGLAGNLAAVLR
jgi:hypothetical protein